MRWVAVALLCLPLAAACSDEAAYDGPGRDHEFVGRSLDELEDCPQPATLTESNLNPSTGTCPVAVYGLLDGMLVAIAWRDGEAQVLPAVCFDDGRVHVAVDDDEIVGAYPEGC